MGTSNAEWPIHQYSVNASGEIIAWYSRGVWSACGLDGTPLMFDGVFQPESPAAGLSEDARDSRMAL
jgi:hypothetical protein